MQISGMMNNASGVVAIFVDDQEPYEGDLSSETIMCEVIGDWFVGANSGVHNVTIVLKGPSKKVVASSVAQPVLHITDIT